MIDGQSRMFMSSDIEFIDYSSVSKGKSGHTVSIPYLIFKVSEETMVLKGKRLIKKFFSQILDGFSELPDEMKNFMLAEHDVTYGIENAERLIDQIKPILSDSKPLKLTLVGDTTLLHPSGSKAFYEAFSAYATHATDPLHQPFNIDWLSDFMSIQFQYGLTEWRGKRGKRVIPVAVASITSAKQPAKIIVYDFGTSFGVVSRLDCGVRPHKIIEVKRGANEIVRLKSQIFHSISECSLISFNEYNPRFLDTSKLSSLEIDDLEFSLTQ